ncbi:family 43 glycosylhydrolase [Vibrio sp.]|nr:family 43 glycosylhydrolase [Vibrio sp.]
MRFNNPIIEQRADPFVYLHSDGYYYFTASVPEYDRLELRRASSLAGLNTTTEIVTVWNKPDKGPCSDLIWAPEIHYINGVWTIYFAAAPNREIKDNAFQHRMYAIVTRDANPLTAVWSDPVQVDSGLASFCLDATCFEHKSEWYYLWAQKDAVIPGNSCLYIAKLSSPISLQTHPVLLSKPELEWEVQGFLVNEGPAVLKRNGKIYVTYSASATDERYCMGLLTIDDNADLLNAENWIKNPLPIYTTVEEKHIFGPGHNSFTTSPDGTQDYMIYHARNYKGIEGDPLWDPNRHTRVHKIEWDENGNPLWGQLDNQVEF